MNRAAFTLAGAAFLLTGCGYIGAPLAPALDMPSRVSDLRAVERGENLVVAFTIPPLTTEGLTLKSVTSVEVRVAVAGGASTLEPVPAAAPGAAGCVIPVREWVGKDVTLTVHATGPKGKTSEWSNEVKLHVEPPVATPADVKPANAPQGVKVTWRGTSPHYRIFRASGDQPPQQIGESDTAEYLDTPVDNGTHYQYFVQAIASESQQSDVAGPFEIVPEHVFPPAVPAGLTAVPGVNSIELAWERNTESDFKGYNVYRSTEGGPFVKIADLITAPTYSDHQVEAGKKYRYAISAVDLTGLESMRSNIEEVTAP